MNRTHGAPRLRFPHNPRKTGETNHSPTRRRRAVRCFFLGCVDQKKSVIDWIAGVWANILTERISASDLSQYPIGDIDVGVLENDSSINAFNYRCSIVGIHFVAGVVEDNARSFLVRDSGDDVGDFLIGPEVNFGFSIDDVFAFQGHLYL